MVAAEDMIAFPDSLTHILAELVRLDVLLRTQVWRMRQLRPQHDNLPALYIADDEIDGLLDKTIGQPFWATKPLPVEMAVSVQETLDEMALYNQQRQALSVQQGISLRLNQLAEHFALDSWAQDVILICLAPEIDAAYGRVYAYLQDDITRQHPSLDLLLNLLCPDLTAKIAARAYFLSESSLCYHRLLELFNETNAPRQSWLDQSLRLDARIVAYLLGRDELDERLQPYAHFHPPQTIRHLPSVPQLDGVVEAYDTMILYFQGGEGAGRWAAAANLGHPLLEINGIYLASTKVDEFVRLVRLAIREAQLQKAWLYWHDFDVFLGDEKKQQREILLENLTTWGGITILAGAAAWEPPIPLPIPFIRIPFALPTATERLHCWQAALPDSTVDLREIANKFRLSRSQIAAAAATAQNQARRRQPENPQITLDDLHLACRSHSNQKLSELAQKIEPHYTWADIVLPPEQIAQLRELCAQVIHRTEVYEDWGFGQKFSLGKGSHVLFSGPPGTGKTMGADIIAGELGLDLYKIDLATVVSKFIGETEKNLARIFTEAETSNAILFFDEADALFGKRTEVRDAHDRYANLEVSYLLQRMEAYEGVTILATNLRKNMDEAFMRRMHFIVEFPFPDAAHRQRIWQKSWPAAAPRSTDVDLAFLAERVLLAGGNIRNITLAASFLAAADGGTITMTHLLHAAQREYQKMGKLLTAEAFKR